MVRAMHNRFKGPRFKTDRARGEGEIAREIF